MGPPVAFRILASVYLYQCWALYRDFLTGFHKRNVEKREIAKKKAIEREKQERLSTRREVRDFCLFVSLPPI